MKVYPIVVRVFVAALPVTYIHTYMYAYVCIYVCMYTYIRFSTHRTLLPLHLSILLSKQKSVLHYIYSDIFLHIQ